MNKFFIKIIAMAMAMALSAPASAVLPSVTWVSRYGDDFGNLDCTITAPCRTFQVAHNNAAAGGTINVLDDADYGPVSITKSITILAVNKIALIRTNTSNAITINAADTDKVVLQGLTIDGVNKVFSGIFFQRAASVYIINSTIKNEGVGAYNSSASPGARMFVQRCNILGNDTGIAVDGAGRVASVLDTLIDSSSLYGLYTTTGVIGLARSVINAGPTAIASFTGGQVISIGPSNIVSGSGTFNATVPFN